MCIFWVPQNATLPTVTDQFTDHAGVPLPILGGDTVTFELTRASDNATVVSRAATIVDGPLGKVSHAWLASETASPGDYYARWKWQRGTDVSYVPSNERHIVTVF